MAEGLIATLLITLIFLYVFGGLGLFVFRQKTHREKSKSTFIKYIVYLIIVLAHIFLIRYAVSYYRILSFLYLVFGFHETYNVRILIKEKISFLSSFLILFIFLIICAGYSAFLFLEPIDLLFLFLVVSAFDGFSQVTGYVFGKTKLMKRISPNKTFEGLAGGIIISLVPAFIIDIYCQVTFIETISKCAIILPAAFLGDFLASLLKRKADIKDFSRLIPGHGGILDRFDSHFMAGAFFFLFRYIF